MSGATLFDGCVDATFVMTMDNSARHSQFMNQIFKYKPSKNVFIVYNSGFKTCKKVNMYNEQIRETNIDILDAYLFICNFAKENNFTRILSLEDDFEFMDVVLKQPSHCKEICSFVNLHDPDVYSLCNGCIFSPDLYNFCIHKRCSTYICPAHALILNTNSILDIFKKHMPSQIKTKGCHVDVNIISYCRKKWFYYRPLCTQKFTYTENSKQWKSPSIGLYVSTLIGLDRCQQGWNILYGIQYTVQIIFLLIIVSTVVKTIDYKTR
tara:strand:+ start:1116 stop:1913 length:798 start_codon:yes stop_codon:yes gene_type:complete